MPFNSFSGLTRFKVPGSELLSQDEMMQPGLGPGSASTQKDPTLLNYLYNTRMKGEIGKRLFNAQRFGDQNESTALQGLQGLYEDQISQSPITAQGEDVAAIEDLNRAAALQGFGSPQEMAYNSRQLEDLKTRLPLMQEELRGAGNLAQQREASRGALAVEQARGDAATANQQSYNELLKTLQGGEVGVSPQGDIRSLTLPGARGGGGVSFQTPQRVQSVPTQLLTQLGNAVRDLTFAEQGGDPTNIATRQAQYNQILSNVFAQSPASEDLKVFAAEIAKHPELRGQSLDMLLQNPAVAAAVDVDLSPEERLQLDQLLRYAAGGR